MSAVPPSRGVRFAARRAGACVRGLAALVAALVAASALAAACGRSGAPAPVRVFAAASLVPPFEAVADALAVFTNRERPQLSFGGSAQLALQLREGAPACVFASADPANMQKVVAAGLVAGVPAVFARNRLAIVVRAGNPKAVRGLADLARKDLVVLLGAADVPIGAYARQALGKAGVAVAAVGEETSVRAIVSKVQAGEADAGIVYRTDCRTDGVEGVAVAAAHDVVAEYQVAVLKGASDPAQAAAFVELLRSEAGRRILRQHGFELP
ncbi:MAG: molybdate ABC transporter substrate-binding protein [Planctomycetota bacterium]